MRFIFMAALAALAAVPAAAQERDAAPADAARAFYAAVQRVRPHQIAPAARADGVDALRPMMTERIAALMDRWAETGTSDDPVTSSPDGATGFSVGACEGGFRAAACDVALQFERGQSSTEWTDRVFLLRESAGQPWRVFDVSYGAAPEGRPPSLSAWLEDMPGGPPGDGGADPG